MLNRKELIRDPAERYVGNVLDITFPRAIITYEAEHRSVNGLGFCCDFDLLNKNRLPIVLIEVTKSGYFDIDPKERQRDRMRQYQSLHPGEFEYAVLCLQHLLDPQSTLMAMSVISNLLNAHLSSEFAEDILLTYARNGPISIEDKNMLHQTINWDDHMKLYAQALRAIH